MSEYKTINNFLSDEDLLICQSYIKSNKQDLYDVLVDGESWNTSETNIIFVKGAENEIESYDVEDEYILKLFTNYNHKLTKDIDYDTVKIEVILSHSKLKWSAYRNNNNMLDATIYLEEYKNIDTVLHDSELHKAKENTCIVSYKAEKTNIPDNIFVL